MYDNIINSIENSILVKNLILRSHETLNNLNNVMHLAVGTYQKGNKILICGNGGSAADAQHIACELVGKFYLDRESLPVISLTNNTSVITAIGNDYGFDELFARQIKAFGNTGDMFLGLTTSGNSKNIINAVEICKNKGITTVVLTGASGGRVKELCDHCICIPSNDTPRVQESHLMIGHILSAIIEKEIFTKEK